MTDWSINTDLPLVPPHNLICGDTYRPDLILHNKRSKKVYIHELTVGFESKLKLDSDKKLSEYKHLVTSLLPSYWVDNFINVLERFSIGVKC